jgi:hypothetical protein
MDRIHAQAHDALERWADAVGRNGGAAITFTGAMTSRIGSWEDVVAANNEVALASGAVGAATELPEDKPGRREVKWVDGKKVDAEVLSARKALDAVVEAGEGDCGACTPLQVTDANLATGLIETSTGPAEVPTWVFSVRGSSVRITRVAVDPSVTVDPPTWNASDPPVGISIDVATGATDSRSVDVQFVGAIGNADEECGAEYEVEAVESELAVVVIVTERMNTPEDGACAAAGKVRTAKLTLEAPLGDRAVLEGRQGLPVPVHPR